MLNTNELIDRIIKERKLIRRINKSIEQDKIVLKRREDSGDKEGVEFWKDIIQRDIKCRRDCHKLIELYLDSLERIYDREVANEQ